MKKLITALMIAALSIASISAMAADKPGVNLGINVHDITMDFTTNQQPQVYDLDIYTNTPDTVSQISSRMVPVTLQMDKNGKTIFSEADGDLDTAVNFEVPLSAQLADGKGKLHMTVTPTSLPDGELYYGLKLSCIGQRENTVILVPVIIRNGVPGQLSFRIEYVRPIETPIVELPSGVVVGIRNTSQYAISGLQGVLDIYDADNNLAASLPIQEPGMFLSGALKEIRVPIRNMLKNGSYTAKIELSNPKTGPQKAEGKLEIDVKKIAWNKEPQITVNQQPQGQQQQIDWTIIIIVGMTCVTIVILFILAVKRRKKNDNLKE